MTAIVVTFNGAGTTAWTCPVGVTSVQAEVWGAGGGGGVGAGGEGGGGGGGYSIETAFAVTAGSNYDVVRGAGGTPGVAGGDSYFNTAGTVMAKGGAGGLGRAGGAGGAAASGVGDTKYSGGNGGTGVAGGAGAGGGGGSSAGSGANGNNGANAMLAVGGAGGAAPTDGSAGGAGGNLAAAGNNGTGFGAGAGGGGAGADAGTGGDGKVTLTYNQTITGSSSGITLAKSNAAATGTLTIESVADATIGGGLEVDGTGVPYSWVGVLIGGSKNMCATNVGPLEISLDLVISVLLVNIANEGETAVADTDVHIATIDPSGNQTNLTWGVEATWTEVDSTDFEGAYKVTVNADQFDEPGVWYILVYPATPGAYYGIPCNFICQVVHQQWPRFSADFYDTYRRMTEFLDSQGVSK